MRELFYKILKSNEEVDSYFIGCVEFGFGGGVAFSQ
jgi:hypothetical protein